MLRFTLPMTTLSCPALSRSAVVVGLLLTATSPAQPLIDAHLHYDAEGAVRYPAQEIIGLLQTASVRAAVVTSRPPGLVLDLYRQAETLIIPFLGVYRTPLDKETWMRDESLPARMAEALEQGPWRGVGELHLFAPHRRSRVFQGVVQLATSRGLPLLMHCDPAVIDALFEQAPEARVIWAHAGRYPYPTLLRDYLDRYPGLNIDLSVREERMAPGGQLDPEWELLLLEYPDRFLVGVDTYRTERWGRYSQVARRIRNWLRQLPDEVSESVAYGNAARLFGTESND